MRKLTEILLDLQDGGTYTIAMHNYQDLELVKSAALSIMGPLWVSVDIEKERYVIKKDAKKAYMKNPDLWY